MKGRKSKKIRNIAIGLVVAVFLLGCGTGIVCDRQVTKDGALEISYKDNVDMGSDGNKKISTVKVQEAEFFTCQMNDQWPDCKKEAREFPDLPDAPLNPKYKQHNVVNNQKQRIVCVDSVSYPKAKIRNSWEIGSDSGREPPAEQGTFQTCFTAKAGQQAWITAAHTDARKSTLLCTVWMYVNGKKKILDFAFAQQLAPCRAKARIR